ncbi:O-antigen ligase family protein [Micromonospora sp. D93]|uniref:O-antigen ligase family protein n=1 Tax=Micromonospora sp. D93 TaxID=2824886 RepID=UPI001B377694|nr:O-antigen ligase family protein [Micromonospora sp. D93]MBQ1017237.1 O-antigen ligase family protein [Micromonospora sp. D93]
MPLPLSTGRARPQPRPCGPSGSLPAVLVLCVVAFMAARPPWWSFNYAALLALLAIGLSGRLPRLRAVDTLALLLAFWAAASPLWSSRTDLTLPAAYRYLSVCLLLVACRHVVRTRRDLLLVGWAYLAGCAVVAVEVVTGARSQGDVLLFAHRYGVDGREVNLTAYTLAVGVVVALVLASAGAHRRSLWLAPLGLVALLGYAVLLTGSRGAAIGVLLGLLTALAAHLLPRLTGITVAGIAGIAVLAVPFGMTPQNEMLWLDGLYGRPTGDISGRLSIWPYALSTWWESPLTGSGAGVFISTNPYEIGPHNLLLTVGNDLGLVGVLLYFGTMAVALVTAARTGRTALLLACAFTAAMLPIWLTGQWETALGFWLALGLLTVLPGIWGPERARGVAPRHARSLLRRTTPAPMAGAARFSRR